MEDFCLLRLTNVKIISEVESPQPHYSTFRAEVTETPCFVKAMRRRREESGKEDLELRSRLHRECVLLNKLRHPSIVQFMGIRYENDPADIELVTGSTYMDLGTCLRTYPTMPLSVRISILLDVASGMLYLHAQSPSIILCNLTPSSIQVTSDMKGIITDLNEAITIGGTAPQFLPVYCQAPEAKAPTPRLQRRTDVFHLGLLALRVFSKGEASDKDTAQPSECELLQSDRSLLSLVSSLLHATPDHRPRAIDICKCLREIATKHPKEFSDVLQLYTEQCKLVQSMALIGSTEAESTELLLRCYTLEQEKSQLLSTLSTLNEELVKLQRQISHSETLAERKKRGRSEVHTLGSTSRRSAVFGLLKAHMPLKKYSTEKASPKKAAATLPNGVNRRQKCASSEISIRPLPTPPGPLVLHHRMSVVPSAHCTEEVCHPGKRLNERNCDGEESRRSSDYEDVEDPSLDDPDSKVVAAQGSNMTTPLLAAAVNSTSEAKANVEDHVSQNSYESIDDQADCPPTSVNSLRKKETSHREPNAAFTGERKVISTGELKEASTGELKEATTGEIEEISTGELTEISTGELTEISTGELTEASDGKPKDYNTPSGEEWSAYEVPVETPLYEYPWFHSNIDVIDAESILTAENKDETYLMRESTSIPGQYTLSVYYSGKLSHLRIQIHNGCYTIDNRKIFNTVVELVKYYQCHNIGIGKCNQACLKHICPRTKNLNIVVH